MRVILEEGLLLMIINQSINQSPSVDKAVSLLTTSASGAFLGLHPSVDTSRIAGIFCRSRGFIYVNQIFPNIIYKMCKDTGFSPWEIWNLAL